MSGVNGKIGVKLMDRGQKDTERIENLIEKRINHEYAVAMKEIEDELSTYFAKFEKKDETWRRWVANGERTKEEYQQWRIGQMAVGRRWAEQKEAIAKQLVETSKTSLDYVRKYSPEIWAENFNYATYQVEHMAGINTPFTLWSKESVNRLVEQNPDIAPPVGKKLAAQIAEGKAVKWNKQQLQSVMIQGILQGDSISKLATRLATQVGDKDRKASIRNARTISTGVQNAGRVDAYKRAEEKGVKLQQMWMATLDGRTRHTHRWLDGEIRPVGEQFSNGLEYPADPHGDASEVYNCRCSLRGVVEGLTPLARQYRDTSGLGGMSYDEWRNAKAKSTDIENQDKKAKQFKREFINQYANGGIIKESIPKPESEAHKQLIENIKNWGAEIEYKEVKYLDKALTESEIIGRISGGDMTKGSCSSLSYAYIANKHGLDVRDFRGGESCEFFALRKNSSLINQLDNVDTQTFYFKKEASELAKKLKELDLEKGKEYRLSCGKHAAIIRNTDKGYEYLELQSAERAGWHLFTTKFVGRYEKTEEGMKLVVSEEKCSMAEKLVDRFKCRKTASNTPIMENGQLLRDENGVMIFGQKVQLTAVDSFKGNDEFKDILGYINTDADKQKKGVGGHEK